MIKKLNKDFIKLKNHEVPPPVKVLSVDDRPENLLVIEDVLEPLGQEIISKRSGDEALKYLLKQGVAVILLDVRMPIIDGLETAALIRQRRISKDTPIIFITAANPTQEDVSKAYALGAVDYIAKPIVPEILKSKVSVFIELYRKTQALTRLTEEKALPMFIELYRETQAFTQLQEEKSLLSNWRDETTKKLLVEPLQKRHPNDFSNIQTQYMSLLDTYLEAIGFARKPPGEKINELADQLGELGGGPRDVIDIHLRSVAQKCQNVHPKRQQAYALEGRLQALELMGYLVDYYRKPSASIDPLTSYSHTKEDNS